MRIKFIFSLLLIFLISETSQAQSAFQFRYRFTNLGDTTTYNAFMMCYGDGTGFIRVRYNDPITHNLFLVEMEMDEHYASNPDGSLDTTRLYFKGKQPRYILGDSTIEYDPEVYWFRKDPKSGIYEPWGITADVGNHITAQGKFLSVSLLQEADLNKDLVLTYFTKDDDLYKNLFGTHSRGLTPTEKAQTRIHLLVVANTKDEVIGISCGTDMNRAITTFADLADLMDIDMDTVVIAGNNYNLENVNKAVSNLNPGPNDIVVFYYTGHGFSKPLDDAHEFPYLDLRSNSHTQDFLDNNRNIEDIFNAVTAKGARFNLVLSDCCNNDPNSNNNIGVAIAHTRGSEFKWSLDNCVKLFMNPKKINILASAAQKGQLATGTNADGGFFSYYFQSAIVSNLTSFKTPPDWNLILADARKNTSANVKASCKKPAGCFQDPIFLPVK